MRARGRGGRGLALAAAGALGLAAIRASAADPPSLVALEWTAPEGCPDAAAVAQDVAHLLPGVSAAGAPYLRASARVSREDSGAWRVELRTEGPQGRGLRTVTAESCVALADATALILALAIDPKDVAVPGPTPSAAPATTAPTEVPRPSEPPPPPSPPKPPTESSQAAAPPEHRDAGPLSHAEGVAPAPAGSTPSEAPGLASVAVAASAALDVGNLPAPAPGVSGGLAIVPFRRARWLRFEAGATVFLDQTADAPPARSGTFSLRAVDAGGCAVTPGSRVEIGGCAGAELDWISAAGLDETKTSRGDAEWVSLRIRATVVYRWARPWAVHADLGGGMNLGRPTFSSLGAGGGLISQPAIVTGRAALGLELRF